MILNELLEIQNEWCKTEKVRDFEEMKNGVNDRQITILMGLRRVGSCLTKNLQW